TDQRRLICRGGAPARSQVHGRSIQKAIWRFILFEQRLDLLPHGGVRPAVCVEKPDAGDACEIACGVIDVLNLVPAIHWSVNGRLRRWRYWSACHKSRGLSIISRMGSGKLLSFDPADRGSKLAASPNPQCQPRLVPTSPRCSMRGPAATKLPGTCSGRSCFQSSIVWRAPTCGENDAITCCRPAHW